MYRRPPRVLIPVLLVGWLVGCSGGGAGDHGATSTTVLGKALGHVENTAGARQYVEFGRPADSAQAHGGAFAEGAYRQVVGQGLGQLGLVSGIVRDKLGFDPQSADYAITVGQPPSTGGLISGVSLGGIGRKVDALGGKQVDGARGTTYRFRPDRNVSDDKLGHAILGVSTELNVVQTDGSAFRHGSQGRARTDRRERAEPARRRRYPLGGRLPG